MYFPRIALSLAGLMFVVAVHGQTIQDSLDLRRDLDIYHRMSRELDIDGILSYLPPKIFTLAPKEMMKNSMKNTFENEDFRMGFDTIVYKSVLPLAKIDNQLCTMVYYDMGMSIVFTGEPDSNLVNIMTGVFAEQYGAENVKPDPRNPAKLNIASLDKKMFALKEPDWDTWKVFEDKRGEGDERTEKMMNMIIPQAVLDYFK